MGLILRVDTAHSQYVKQTEIIPNFFDDWRQQLDSFDTSEAIKKLLSQVRSVDEFIQTNEPFKQIKINEQKAKEDVAYSLAQLSFIAESISVFLPRTSAKILECIRENKMPEKPLFARLP
jgi:methionyl-tRNA synthetase